MKITKRRIEEIIKEETLKLLEAEPRGGIIVDQNWYPSESHYPLIRGVEPRPEFRGERRLIPRDGSWGGDPMTLKPEFRERFFKSQLKWKETLARQADARRIAAHNAEVMRSRGLEPDGSPIESSTWRPQTPEEIEAHRIEADKKYWDEMHRSNAGRQADVVAARRGPGHFSYSQRPADPPLDLGPPMAQGKPIPKRFGGDPWAHLFTPENRGKWVRAPAWSTSDTIRLGRRPSPGPPRRPGTMDSTVHVDPPGAPKLGRLGRGLRWAGLGAGIAGTALDAGLVTDAALGHGWPAPNPFARRTGFEAMKQDLKYNPDTGGVSGEVDYDPIEVPGLGMLPDVKYSQFDPGAVGAGLKQGWEELKSGELFDRWRGSAKQEESKHLDRWKILSGIKTKKELIT